jgi:glycosyltransferase involved in cell wall biosynthesis
LWLFPIAAKENGKAKMSKPRERLCVVLMTKNEEDKLIRCLEAVKWADEIVIVDDFSTDKTVELARRYTDKIIFHASLDNHDQQWNLGIDAASAEWILHIDADEIVPESLRQKIAQILLDAKGFCAFRMMRRNHFLGRWMRFGGWTHSHLILFRKDSSRCVGKGIHVKVEVKGKIGALDAYIDHYPFKNITQFIDRQNHYSNAQAKEMFADFGQSKIKKELKRNLKSRPFKLFWKMFVKKGAFRDGMHGFIFSVLFSWAHFLLWAKYWELSSSLSDSQGRD